MNDEKISLAIKAVHQYQGDNLARAEHVFKGLSKIEMQEQHGQSGRARQDIIDDYREHYNECERCIDWLKMLS